MAFDINGALVQTENTALKITANSNIGLSTNAQGFVTLSSRPYFIAYSTAGWIYHAATWLTPVLGSTYVNNGSCYNTTNYQFTAPVSGTYYFEFSAYWYKNDSSAATYNHPGFWVNGSSTYRMASQTTAYRLRVRTYYDGNYSADTQVNDVIYLGAGDYVGVQCYASAGQQFYGLYSHFTGFLIG